VGKFLNGFYETFANPGLAIIAEKLGIKFDFLVEAGCHDGSDTLKFLENTKVELIFAFEPDRTAAQVAQTNFAKFPDRVRFKQIALLDAPGWAGIYSPTGVEGDGSTIFRNLTENEVASIGTKSSTPVSTLDLEIETSLSKGALWLDVEGAAHLVISGGARTLQKIQICQIEVDMHPTSKQRQANYFKVHEQMKNHGFLIYCAPLHPGYFGDTIYIRCKSFNLKTCIRAKSLGSLMKLLHGYVYPNIGKPV